MSGVFGNAVHGVRRVTDEQAAPTTLCRGPSLHIARLLNAPPRPRLLHCILCLNSCFIPLLHTSCMRSPRKLCFAVLISFPSSICRQTCEHRHSACDRCFTPVGPHEGCRLRLSDTMGCLSTLFWRHKISSQIHQLPSKWWGGGGLSLVVAV